MVTLFKFFLVTLFLKFCVFSTEIAAFYIPTSTVWGLQFVHIVLNTCDGLISTSHPGGYEAVSHCGFDLCFPKE